jgi:hypothetical protein
MSCPEEDLHSSIARTSVSYPTAASKKERRIPMGTPEYMLWNYS